MKKILAVFSLMVVLTACGGDDGGGRPSQDEIAKALKSSTNSVGQAISAAGGGTISDEVIDCFAKALHDSDVSDGVLNALVKNDNDYKASSKDTDALQKVISEDLPKCITG